MQRVLELFHREFKSVREAALLLAIATVGSNLLALFRDRLLASRFGAGIELDMYYAAFRVPDLLYSFSLFFVASTAIIPLFLSRLTESEDHAREFINTVFFAFFAGIGTLLIVAYLLMPFLVPFFVPGFTADIQKEVVWMSRVLLISPLLLGISGLMSSVLQSLRRFLVYAATFLFYNAGIIAGIFLFVPRWGVRGLAWGVVLGALLHVAVQVPSLVRAGFVPRFATCRFSELVFVFRSSFPRTLGLIATQVTFVAVTAIASLLGAGSIAVFQLSFNLQSIPLAVIGLSYSVAAFPTMAELIVKKERTLFFDHLISTSRHIILWTLPMTVLCIVLRAQIVRVVLGTGEFGWTETRLIAASLALFSIGIVAQSLSALFVRALHAIGNVWIPVIVNAISLVGTVILAFFFTEQFRETGMFQQFMVEMLRVADVPQNAVLGLPLAFAIGALGNAVLLGLYLGKMDSMFRSRQFLVSVGEVFSASILLGGTSYALLQALAPLLDINTFWGIFLQGFLAGLFGIAVAGLFLHIRRNKELGEVLNVFSRAFWRKGAVGLEQEHL